MTEHILVTGGAGFIGSHIVDAFLAAGHTVAVVDNLSTGKRQNLNPAAAFYQVDIRDAAALAEVFAAEQPTVVCHQAALAEVRGSLRDPAGYAQVNVVGTLNLLEAGRAAGSVRRFLFASTGGAVYGEPAELPASGDMPGAAARSLRRQQAGLRGLHRHLPPQLRPELRDPALRQRVRSAAGSFRRGGRRGDLRRRHVGRPAGDRQRRWLAAARFRLRGRHRPRQPGRAGRRRKRHLQPGHRGPDRHRDDLARGGPDHRLSAGPAARPGQARRSARDLPGCRKSGARAELAADRDPG